MPRRPYGMSEETYEDALAEMPSRTRYRSCGDRMCGAYDCKTCHPENFIDGVYYENLEEDE